MKHKTIGKKSIVKIKQAERKTHIYFGLIVVVVSNTVRFAIVPKFNENFEDKQRKVHEQKPRIN